MQPLTDDEKERYAEFWARLAQTPDDISLVRCQYGGRDVAVISIVKTVVEDGEELMQVTPMAILVDDDMFDELLPWLDQDGVGEEPYLIDGRTDG